MIVKICHDDLGYFACIDDNIYFFVGKVKLWQIEGPENINIEENFITLLTFEVTNLREAKIMTKAILSAIE
jgi:hypothetical protein